MSSNSELINLTKRYCKLIVIGMGVTILYWLLMPSRFDDSMVVILAMSLVLVPFIGYMILNFFRCIVLARRAIITGDTTLGRKSIWLVGSFTAANYGLFVLISLIGDV